MNHPIHKITACKKVAPFTLELTFDDNKMQVINFEPVLCGELYGPLRDENLFDQVRIDSEVQTIFWPNGADFEPSLLHDWDIHADELIARARQWELITK
ncbi:MAG: DUF2442 domain-containing protein [Bacteroidetes bacterium]|nr:DUF2442 domain-containing protein [Bacteroidota bacterium]